MRGQRHRGTLTLKLETGNPGLSNVEIPQSVTAGLNQLVGDVSTAPDGIVKAVVFPDLGAEGRRRRRYHAIPVRCLR